jgi:hypothetical protein
MYLQEQRRLVKLLDTIFNFQYYYAKGKFWHIYTGIFFRKIGYTRKAYRADW